MNEAKDIFGNKKLTLNDLLTPKGGVDSAKLSVDARGRYCFIEKKKVTP